MPTPPDDAIDPIEAIEVYRAKVERLTREMFDKSKARHPANHERGAVIYHMEDYR